MANIKLHDKSNYQIESLEDEIKADQSCAELLKIFHQDLLNNKTTVPLEAGSKAAGADYFLREFVIGFRRQNIFSVTAEEVKQFAGHWYIIKTLEPNMVELESILQGTNSFYHYCAEKQLVEQSEVARIKNACSLLDYFEQRIEDFHNITGDGFRNWEAACPL